MAKMRNKGMSMTVWALMGLLMFGLAGFGVQNFGGSATTVATVDGQDITADDYARALDQQMRAFSAQIGKPVTMAEAQSLGIDRSVRAQLVGRAILDGETARTGLSVGDARVQAEVLKIPAFQGLDGRFDRAAYREALARAGLTIPGFEASLREDAARGLLQTAMAGGGVAAPVFIDRLIAYLGETRAVTTLTLAEATLPEPLGEPDEPTLRAWYDAHLADFTLPEARRISYAWATPASRAAAMPADEAALRAAYQARLSDFVQPERRLVERLAFGTEEEAAAAKADLDAGRITFDGLLASRRLTVADIDMGDVAKSDLGAAGDAVFALPAPAVVGPLPSDFGPALYRMNGILAAQEITFEEARGQLQEEVGADAARRELAGKVAGIDDLLAGGATVQELAAEVGLDTGSIDFRPGDETGVAAYPEFREAAAAAQTGDFPRLVQLSDGGILVMQMEAVVPPAPIPFDEARGSVTAAWQQDELTRRLAAQADAIEARIRAGEAMEALGLPVETLPEIRRDSRIATLPAAFVPEIFAMAPGDLRRVPGDGTLILARLDGVTPADRTAPDVEAVAAALSQQAAQGIGQDLLDYFVQALQPAASVSFNEAAANAVHSRFQR